MNKTISLSKLSTESDKKVVTAIASKSMAHRLLIASALTSWQAKLEHKQTEDYCKRISLSTTSADIEATKKCLDAMEEALFDGKDTVSLYCGESGSTLRFLLPVVAALGINGAFMPEGRLPQRPLSPLYEEMASHGVVMSKQHTVPFTVSKKMTGGKYTIPGDISSQYITGLLFALPLLKEDSSIIITGRRESVDYIKMTLKVLDLAKIRYTQTKEGFFVPGNQKYQLSDHVNVEGDWSNAATWAVLGCLCKGGILCKNVSFSSAQGDKRVLDVLEDFGANVERDEENQCFFVSCKETGLCGTTIDAANIPDLIPVLSVAALYAKGQTRVINAQRLRIKESDRLLAIKDTLTALGGSVLLTEDGLLIEGGHPLFGGTVSSVNDHRIVMMAALVSAITENGAVTITDAQAINKSFPTFFEECKALGAVVE